MAGRQAGVILTIFGGIFYLVGSLAGAAIGAVVGGFASAVSNPSGNVGASEGLGVGVLIWGAVSGAFIIAGGVMLNSDNSGTRKAGGIVALAMMLIGAIPTLGGLIIGFILVLVGGILGLTYKPTMPDFVIGYQQVPIRAVQAPAQAMGSMNFCPKCGVPVHQGSAFCANCGSQVPSY